MVASWWIALAAILGMAVGAVLARLGGMGEIRKLKNDYIALNGDLAALGERITREQKRRASIAAAEAREEKRSEADIAREATERLAREPAQTTIPVVPGFRSMFNRG